MCTSAIPCSAHTLASRAGPWALAAQAARAALGGLGGVDGGVRAAVDHGAVQGPIDFGVVVRVREVELARGRQSRRPTTPRSSARAFTARPELAVGAGHERAARGHGQRVLEHGMGLVGLGELALGKRDGPFDAQLGVGEVDEGVGLLELRRPVGVHQVRVPCRPRGLEGSCPRLGARRWPWTGR